MTAETLRRTPLHAQHVHLGGRIVDFHGWELPIQYEGILREHQTVRSVAGLFDVSHMGQVWVKGPQALEFLQKVNVNDIGRIGPGKAIYSHLTNEKGGIVDDVIVSCFAKDRYLVVVNAATATSDFEWLSTHARGFDVSLSNDSGRYGMVALQGPKAAMIAATDFPAISALPRFGALELRLFDQPSVITRTGYTGEDGFEFIVPAEVISRLWDNLLLKGRSHGLVPCGLGARDTLRLEAGYLLYGQDVDEKRTPLEAGFDWVVKWDKGDFIGRDALARQKKEGLKERLTAVSLKDRGVPRPGAAVSRGGAKAGELISATFSPSLQKGIGWGYLSPAGLAVGTELSVEIHGRQVPAEVVAPPFYQGGAARKA